MHSPKPTSAPNTIPHNSLSSQSPAYQPISYKNTQPHPVASHSVAAHLAPKQCTQPSPQTSDWKETYKHQQRNMCPLSSSDRKPWTALETRSLISLRDDMNLKFQVMKRNRSLWEELSARMRSQFGHQRTASQCSVRWKNLIASYKESRDNIKLSPAKAKACPFFKEVEAVLRDEPLLLPIQSHEHTGAEVGIENGEQKRRGEATNGAVVEGKDSNRKREREHSAVMSMLGEIKQELSDCMSVLKTQGRLLGRIMRKLGMDEEGEWEEKLSVQVPNVGGAQGGVTGEVEKSEEGEEMHVGEGGITEATGVQGANLVETEPADGQSHDREREQGKVDTEFGNNSVAVEEENDCGRESDEEVREEAAANAEVVSDEVDKAESRVISENMEDVECEGVKVENEEDVREGQARGEGDVEVENEGDVTEDVDLENPGYVSEVRAREGGIEAEIEGDVTEDVEVENEGDVTDDQAREEDRSEMDVEADNEGHVTGRQKGEEDGGEEPVLKRARVDSAFSC
eukprot:GFKZ01004610.1.p1 GENE.GFKZ01004610.1~~GFKZ01004610.1.p1  ORF type:complete len:514 (-),score=102.28 GFKZ01004610.1:1183-2724(-)